MDLGTLLDNSSTNSTCKCSLISALGLNCVLNYPKITLKTTRSTLSYICTTGIGRILNFDPFTLRPSAFELHAILRQVHLIQNNL